jgi:hemerythrin-like domain-containing protein
MSEVLRLLREEHDNLEKILQAVEHQLQAYDQSEVPDWDVVNAAIDYVKDYPDRYHHPKEDLIYERLKERDPGLAIKVGDLQDEHTRLAETTRHFAHAVENVLGALEVPREAFDKASRDFLDLYREHMFREEGEFFPAAERTLTAEDWAEIDAHLANPEDPIFGAGVDERFDILRDNILTWDAEC